MSLSSRFLENLIDEFARLPSIGRKTAQRLALHVLKAPREEAARLAEAILLVKDRVGFCSLCGNYAEQDPCPLCADPRRDHSLVCVVEQPVDVLAIERTASYRGVYHVLRGVLSPLDGVGPDDLRVRELLQRLQDGAITELILATDPNLEGEATATYLTRLLLPMGLRVTRLASGLPVGGDLEYADEVTLGRAFSGRRLLDV